MRSPRVLADEGEARARLARLRELHVAPLTDLVERIRATRGDGEAVPWFDPDSGGVDAEVLLLFEAPGPRAVGTTALAHRRRGSGFISPDNNDATATNVLLLEEEAGLDRRRVLHWNIVPWYVGDGTRIRGVNARDLEEALPWLAELLQLLPCLKVVVLCGRKPQRGWTRYSGPRPHGLVVLACPHPSPVNVNSRREARGVILSAFDTARRVLDGGPVVALTAEGTAARVASGVASRGAESERSAAAPRDRMSERPPHAQPHPDALFAAGLTSIQAQAQRVLAELVASTPAGQIRVGHVDPLAALFDEWAIEHAERRRDGWYFTSKSGTGLWHVLQGLCPLADPDRWDRLRGAVIAHLEESGRWRRVSPPRGSTWELTGER